MIIFYTFIIKVIMENAYIIQEQNGFHSVIILQIYNF